MCKEGTKSPKDLKSKGETKDPLDYGLEGVALCGAGSAIPQDKGGHGEAAALSPVAPSSLPSSPLAPGSRKGGKGLKPRRRSLPVHFLLKVS